MGNREDFMGLYNKLDSLCRDRFSLDDRSESSIMALINSFRHSDYYKYNDMADDLDAIRNLRNSLVHTPLVDGESLIEINPLALDKLKEILEAVENPPLARDRAIPFSKVFSVKMSDPLLLSMRHMSMKGYSHAPVLDERGNLIGVFSEGVVFSYLSDKGETNLKDGDTIAELSAYLPLDNHRNERYAFLSRNATLEEAVKLFQESKSKYGKRLGLLFLTEHGKENEKILYALVLGSTLK